ncbi:MAG: RNA polymerase sigma factor RpoH [Gammaproteobacteria bacterium]|nr:MAG: RNA polymerase sigma factor RpoH [Gammaproteobacteria bacterium]
MSMYLPITANLNSESGLATYIQGVNAIPVLSSEDEISLAQHYRQNQDLEAARQLVLGHLRHVVNIARKFSGYGLPQADLIQEGNIGLMKAVKNFDPDRGVRLISFAVHWIKAEIYEYVLRNWRIVKVATTKAQRKLFFNLRKSRTRLGWMNQNEVNALAENLDVPVKTVKDMEGRMSSPDVSFEIDQDNDEDNYFAPAAYLQDMRYNPEALVIGADQADNQQARLVAAMQKLDERSRDIIQQRWLGEDKSTLHNLADKYGVSAERIRQIEKKAMEVMKKEMSATT